MPRKTVGTWEGGYIAQAHGRNVYVIKRQVNGRAYEISTRASSHRAAVEHLVRFEADPLAYRPGGDADAAPIQITGELAVAFLDWSAARGNSSAWLKAQKRFLGWWAGVLRGVDLRALQLGRQVLPPLDKARTSRRHRIEVLKRFCSWLVEEQHLLSIDPTAALHVPQARPEQLQRTKAITPETYAATYDKLEQAWRDPLDVLAGTGWHGSELLRFAREGELVELLDANDPTVAGVLTTPRHKSGVAHRSRVTSHVLEAAKRLRKRGGLSWSRFASAVRRAAKAAGLEAWSPGQMRHAVATYAVERVSLAAASGFLGHASEQTTKRFYATHAAPPKVPTMR